VAKKSILILIYQTYQLIENREMRPFEEILSVSKEEIEFELRGISEVGWDSLLLKPRAGKTAIA
jgi:hypothetical protein